MRAQLSAALCLEAAEAGEEAGDEAGEEAGEEAGAPCEGGGTARGVDAKVSPITLTLTRSPARARALPNPNPNPNPKPHPNLTLTLTLIDAKAARLLGTADAYVETKVSPITLVRVRVGVRAHPSQP